MPTRWFVSHTARIGLQIEACAAVARTYLKSVEARIQSLDIMVSDVFGADAFVSRRASPPPMPIAEPAEKARARWDEGLEFDASGPGAPVGGETVCEGTSVDRNCETQSDAIGEDVPRAAPRFLIPAVYGHRLNDDLPEPAKGIVRSRLLVLSGAFLLLIAWINAGQSGTLRRSQPSAADSLADRFSGSDDGTSVASNDTPHLVARLRFAPRFAVFFAEFAPVNGASGEKLAPPAEPAARDLDADDNENSALARMHGASSVVIRNLPPGTVLTPGLRVSQTDWKLKSDELKSIVVKVPADRIRPIRATIEMLGDNGASLGEMAVEIREHPAAAKENQRETAAVAGGAIAPAKRRPVRAVAGQVASKALAKSDGAKAAPANPSTQPLFPQLPFLPGPYSATPPPGNTVSQQILINLGVFPATPSAALTQGN